MMLFVWLAAASVADVEAIAPAQEQVPTSGEIGVPVDSALVLRRFPPPRAVRLIDAAGDTNLQLETALQGIAVARLPEQAPDSEVHVAVEQDFDGDGIVDFTEDVTWRTGSRRVVAAAPEIVEARVEQPLFEGRRALFEVSPDPDRAVLALFLVDEQGLRTQLNAQFNATTLIDFGYQGGVQEYALVAVDRAGNVSEAAPVTIGEGGCNAMGQLLPLPALLIVLLVVGRRRSSAPRASRPRHTRQC